MTQSYAQSFPLLDAITHIAQAKDLPALYDALCQTAEKLFGAKKTAVFQCLTHKGEVRCLTAKGLAPTLVGDIINAFKTFPLIPKLHEPIAIALDSLDTPGDQQKISLIEGEHIQALTLFPIHHSKQEQICMVSLYDEPAPLTPELVKMGEAIASVGGQVWQSIQLGIKKQQSEEREQKINEINLLLNSSKDLPTVLLNVVRLSADLIGADAGLLGVLIDSEMMTFYPHNIPQQVPLRPAARGRGVAWEIVKSGRSILTEDYFSLRNAQPKWKPFGIRSFLGVPLMSGNECLGVLTLFRLKQEDAFSQRDLWTVEMIGRQAATTIENIRMYSEATHRANALASALNRQEELDKLKNQFIQNVSHELRSPLGIIFGHAELLESGILGEVEGDQLESIQIITRRARMLSDLVDDLTALLAAETQEFRREAINTALLVTAVSLDHKIKAKALDINVETYVEEELPWLNGDQTHLQRVFDNLFSNAFKFTPAGGSVCLYVRAQEGNVIFEFSDNGEGIEADKLSRIFNRFYQVKRDGKPRKFGTGLGLALVKEIVEAHRGHVTATSVHGQGTTFTITLPGYPPPAL